MAISADSARKAAERPKRRIRDVMSTGPMIEATPLPEAAMPMAVAVWTGNQRRIRTEAGIMPPRP